MEERYFLELACAFVRGKLGQMNGSALFLKPLTELSPAELEELFRLGVSAELRMHKFKRSMDLPRVQNVLGILKGMQPENLLDIGSGRGVFLWPLLNAFPALAVMSVDIRQDRVDDLLAVNRGGIERLAAGKMDACRLELADGCFDVVSILEVLEHMPEAQKALNEAVRVCKRAVIISVPSKEDDNPDHIHLLERNRLQVMMEQAGARARFGGVLNHLIVVGTKKQACETA